jgi:signal recognition particle subunit SRP68
LDLERTASKLISSHSSQNQIPLKLHVDTQTLKMLHNTLRHHITQTQALTELQKATDASSASTIKSTPLIERLGSYPEGKVDLTNLVTYPAKIEPVPVKPVFLDVAWNHIQYPGTKKPVASASADEGRLPKGKAEDESRPAGKRGWFGFGGGGS